MKKRVYSKEFKDRAVRLSYQRENVKALGDELGIGPTLALASFLVPRLSKQ